MIHSRRFFNLEVTFDFPMDLQPLFDNAFGPGSLIKITFLVIKVRCQKGTTTKSINTNNRTEGESHFTERLCQEVINLFGFGSDSHVWYPVDIIHVYRKLERNFDWEITRL